MITTIEAITTDLTTLSDDDLIRFYTDIWAWHRILDESITALFDAEQASNIGVGISTQVVEEQKRAIGDRQRACEVEAERRHPELIEEGKPEAMWRMIDAAPREAKLRLWTFGMDKSVESFDEPWLA